MSDLAPFVAATIRDKVVEELLEENRHQKEENEALESEVAELKRTVHERDPRRSVKLTGPRGTKVFKENILHLSVAESFPFVEEQFITFFNPRGDDNERRGLVFPLRNFSIMELWIDGGCAVRLKDLTFRYGTYKYDQLRVGWKYMMIVSARDEGHALDLEFTILDISPEDHAKLLNRDTIVDFVPPNDRESSNRNQYTIEGRRHADYDKELSIERLVELCGKKRTVAIFDRWKCTGEFFFQHLTVPYVVIQND